MASEWKQSSSASLQNNSKIALCNFCASHNLSFSQTIHFLSFKILQKCIWDKNDRVRLRAAVLLTNWPIRYIIFVQSEILQAYIITFIFNFSDEQWPEDGWSLEE